MWRNWNPWASLVRMSNGIATVGNDMEAPQKKLNIEPPTDSPIPPLGIYPRELKEELE